MSIIKTHDITLYGGNEVDLVLRPLSDEYLPFLYKWNSDPDVLYWTEGGLNLSYDAALVEQIYGGVSQNAHCFLVETDGIPIGECWLQKMNLEKVKVMYPEGFDVRRIDMMIGEKNYWNKGLGTEFVRMLVDFAFYGEHVDVLHCICEDCNVRSCRVWEKNGFTKVLEESLPEKRLGKWRYHYRFTRDEFVEKGRISIPVENQFTVSLNELQPSQLYISEGKMRLVHEWFDPTSLDKFDPIPVLEVGNRFAITDGHTRVMAALFAGLENIPAYIDPDEIRSSVETRVSWCQGENIFRPSDLVNRVVAHKDYEKLWRKRCMENS